MLALAVTHCPLSLTIEPPKPSASVSPGLPLTAGAGLGAGAAVIAPGLALPGAKSKGQRWAVCASAEVERRAVITEDAGRGSARGRLRAFGACAGVLTSRWAWFAPGSGIGEVRFLLRSTAHGENSLPQEGRAAAGEVTLAAPTRGNPTCCLLPLDFSHCTLRKASALLGHGAMGGCCLPQPSR